VLGFEPMTYGSESECDTHYTTAPHADVQTFNTFLKPKHLKSCLSPVDLRFFTI